MFRSIQLLSAIRILAVTITFVAIACGQTLPHKTYSTADGLANDFVEDIVRDSRGFLWFCTGEGLSRFDGYGFRNYTIADGLPHRTVNDLLELGDGTFLVATSDGIAIFDPIGTAVDPVTDQSPARPMFKVIRSGVPPFDQQPFRAEKLTSLSDGRVLVTTVWAIFILSKDGVEWRFEQLKYDSWRSLEFTDAVTDKRGNYWVGSQSGIWWVDPKAGDPVLVSGVSPTMLFLDRNGNVWSGIGIGHEGLGYFGYDESSRPVQLRKFKKADGLADDVWINDIFETADGRILVGTGNGVSEFIPGKQNAERSFVTISGTKATAVGEDLGGNIWVGTAITGAVRITRHGFDFFAIPEVPPYTSVTSIFKSGDGSIYLTSSESLLYRFEGDRFEKIIPGGFRSRSWGWNQLDLRSSVAGEWWIPGADGLYRYPPVAFRALAGSSPKQVYNKRSGLLGDAIFNTFEDSRGDIWISYTGIAAVSRWVRRTDRFEHLTNAENLPESSGTVAFGEDAAGNVWIGLYTGGVARFKNGRFDRFPAPEYLPATMINQIFRDSKGRLWLAVNSGGIVQVEDFDGDQPRFKRISVADGLSSVQANCITEDKSGRIYVGTAKGINRIDPETGRIKVISQADGLPGSNINRCAVDDDGNLWFAQRFTVVRMTPEADERAPAPTIFVSEIRANGERVRSLSELGESLIDGIRLGTDQRRIQISFFSLAFGTGESPTFQYRLDGSEWSDPTHERTVVLNQSPGTFRFEVRALNSQGIASEAPAIVEFSIAYPLWQRWWFLLLIAFAVGTVVYWIYRVRLNRLIELERVRMRIATDLHDDIGSSLSQIAILSEVARRRPGVAEPLDQIAETSRETLDSMSDIVWAINPSKDNLHDLLHRMRRFASDVLDAKEIDCRFDFNDGGRGISLGADMRREIFLMFKECVNNVAKHSGAKSAKIGVRSDEREIKIRVEDDGVGFQSDQEHDGQGGNGLINLKRRAETLGGVARIESEEKKGTVVEISIPLKHSRIF